MEIYIVKNYVMYDGCIDVDEVFAYANEQDALSHFNSCIFESKLMAKDYNWNEDILNDDEYYCAYKIDNFSTDRVEVQLIKTKVL